MSSGTPAQRQQLEDAFLVFNQVSEQLADSYAQLQKRVAGLNQELAAARSERMRQLAEKERLANRLSTLLDGLPAGVVLVDGESVVQQYNPAAKELLPSLEHGSSWQSVFSIEVEGAGQGEELSLRSGRLLTLSERSLEPEDGRHHPHRIKSILIYWMRSLTIPALRLTMTTMGGPTTGTGLRAIGSGTTAWPTAAAVQPA